MKKLLFAILFIASFNLVNAEERVFKSKEEFLIEMAKLEQEIQKEKDKTQAMKRETESAIKVNKKLDELIGVLSKDK